MMLAENLWMDWLAAALVVGLVVVVGGVALVTIGLRWIVQGTRRGRP